MSNLAGILGQLNNPSNIALSFQQGMQTGQAQREEREVRGALASYAMNPDDPGVFQTLAQYRPELAIKLRETQVAKQKELLAQETRMKAAQGDPAAKARLAGIDIDAWAKIDGPTQKRLKDQVDFVGQAALAVKQLPLEQQPAAWDNYIQQGVGLGFDALKDYQGKFSPQALDGAIANAGLVKDFLGTQEIKWQQVGERPSFATDAMGRPIGSANPYSGAGGTAEMAAPTSKEEFDALPPGATFKAPDGTTRVKPGGGGSNVTGGFPG